MPDVVPESKRTLDVLERGTDWTCGEGCGRRARVILDGDYPFCEDCLFHLVKLGWGFRDAVGQASESLRAVGYSG
jgi:hypothetical protein